MTLERTRQGLSAAPVYSTTDAAVSSHELSTPRISTSRQATPAGSRPPTPATSNSRGRLTVKSGFAIPFSVTIPEM
jgi:hypothetical protein